MFLVRYADPIPGVRTSRQKFQTTPRGVQVDPWTAPRRFKCRQTTQTDACTGRESRNRSQALKARSSRRCNAREHLDARRAGAARAKRWGAHLPRSSPVRRG